MSYDCHTTINRAKLALIGVITADDDRGVHPQRFRYGCNNICKRTEKAGKEGKDYTPQLTRFEWGETSEVALRKVGPKPKKAPIGRLSYITTELVAHMKEVAPPSAPLARDLREKLSRLPSMDGDLKCVLCNLMLDRPLPAIHFSLCHVAWCTHICTLTFSVHVVEHIS